jgi:hypothetical protein
MSVHKRLPALAQRVDTPCEDAATVRLDLSKAPFQVAAPARSSRQHDILAAAGDQGTTRVDLSGLARFARDCEGSEVYADAIIERLGSTQGAKPSALTDDGAWQESPTVLIDGKVPLPDLLLARTTGDGAERAEQGAPLRENSKERTVTAVHRRLRRTRAAQAARSLWVRAWWGLLGFGCGFAAAIVLQPYLHGPWREQLMTLVQRVWAG